MVTSKGEWFYSENQGEWVGSGRVNHVMPGDFAGHPAGLATAEKPESYSVAGFSYLYHKAYGSAPLNRLGCPVRKVVVAPDGLSVRLARACLREGYIHEIKALGIDGNAQSFVPESADVLFHTALTQPGTSDTIFSGGRIV